MSSSLVSLIEIVSIEYIIKKENSQFINVFGETDDVQIDYSKTSFRRNESRNIIGNRLAKYL